MKLDKVIKQLGKDTVAELDAMSSSELETRVVRAEQSIKQAKDELENNPNFLDLKEKLNSLSSGLKEVRKRQNAIIAYSLHRLEEQGK